MKLKNKGWTVGLASVGVVGLMAVGAGTAFAVSNDQGSNGNNAQTSAQRMAGHGDQNGQRSGQMGRGGSTQASAEHRAEIAAYLGLSAEDLQAKMQAGTSLADIASAQGKSVAGLTEVMVTAAEAHINANTNLTAEQKDRKSVV